MIDSWNWQQVTWLDGSGHIPDVLVSGSIIMSKASYVIDLVLADMFCLNGCHPSKCPLVKLFPCWSGWTLPVQLKAPRESGDPSSIIIMLWSAKVSCYISQSCLSVTGHTNLPTHVKYAPMHGRTRGPRGSCSLKHQHLPADTVTHLPTHSLRNEGDGLSASHTEIDTGALNPFWHRQKVLKDTRGGKTCSWGGKGCDRGVSR